MFDFNDFIVRDHARVSIEETVPDYFEETQYGMDPEYDAPEFDEFPEDHEPPAPLPPERTFTVCDDDIPF